MNLWHDIRLMNRVAAVLFLTASAALMYALTLAALRSTHFDIRTIEIRGLHHQPLQHMTPALIRANALSGLRGGFFTLDLAAAQRAFETVPWVRKAGIARHWPDRLVVTIEEHIPAALWSDGRGINSLGEWFATNPAELEPYRDLPELSGPAGTEQRLLSRLNDFVEWFAPVDMKPRAVELSSRYAWRVTMDNGMVIELGRELEPNAFKERITRFVEHFAAVRSYWGGTPSYADLRYPNGFAVKIPGVKFIQP